MRDHIHTALRDGGLDAEPVLRLACLLEEQGVSTATTRELLERPTAELTAADLTRLGSGLLRDTGPGPGFVFEPGPWTLLEQALKIVERDVRAAGITGTLRLTTDDQDGSGHARVEFQGGYQGNGIPPHAASHPQEALACVADATQEVIMELTWSVWPTCPTHDRGLHAELEHGRAVWRCTPGDPHTVAPIGEMP
ncbi:hypothetical protein [Nonomuraea sp. NPDC050783]|uniref:hypothetical protein n=1 Tax=Nonomuraea sp. NPDC050783 TaxID=3154634 RepID=UPI003467BCAE